MSTQSGRLSPGSPETTPRPYIGGQAVIEGVMMRAPTSFAIVVRRKDGSLHVRERSVPDARTGFAKLPFVRGIASLGESLKLGSESLKFSADQYEKDLNDEESAKNASRAGNLLSAFSMSLLAVLQTDGADSAGASKKNASFMPMLVVMMGFFVFLPQMIAEFVNRALKLNLELQSPGFQALTGAIKLTIVIGYLTAIRQVKDIQRIFQYHGAEHKTISTYEALEALTVANARAKTTLHARCGTTFLVMVALVSVLVFTVLGGLLPKIDLGNRVFNSLAFFVIKMPFIPIIASITFELQRVFARYCSTGPLRILLWPGFLVQKITTMEPADDQLEIALASLRVTLFRESGEVSGSSEDVKFPNYDAVLGASRLREAAE
jgi:uncharacterized protein YqhQ